MRLLALDTATEDMAVALVDGDDSRCVQLGGGAQASSQLVPTVMTLLAEHGWRFADLQAVAFGQGPGAFTGLRTAVSAAQGFAFGVGCPVLPLDSLMIVAEAARQRHPGRDAWWVAMDARMDEVYAAAYRHDGCRWQVEQAPALYDLETLGACWRVDAPAAVVGTALAAFGARLPLPQPLPLQCPERLDRAAALAVLARSAWQQGLGRPAHEALPLYLRDKVALTTAEREAARRAAGTPA